MPVQVQVGQVWNEENVKVFLLFIAIVIQIHSNLLSE